MYRSLFPNDLFSEVDRLQRRMQQAFDLSPSIRGFGREGFPALNVGSTPEAFEVYAFAPGIDPATLDVQLERGLLTVSGERRSATADLDPKARVHIRERFEGRFSRSIALPDDADPEQVEARCRDGVLRIRVNRRSSSLPRRIAVQ